MFAKVMSTDCIFNIDKRVTIGQNVTIGPNCKKISIGYGSFIGRDIYIDVQELTIGEYTTIHHGSIIHGIKTEIGHNCWFGHYTIIDSLGGNTQIKNNVGVGAHSQLWSHMKFGDTLEGCRWNSSGSLILEDDVWLVGHSIVGPIHAHPKSMLMTGGVATKDMLENHIYAGSPASDLTQKLGHQFKSIDPEIKLARFEDLKIQFTEKTGIDCKQFVAVDSFTKSTTQTEFNIFNRTYRPRRTDDEHMFIKFMLYDKAKFIPTKT